MPQHLASLLQVEAQAMPKGPKNPHGNAFTSKETELQTEKEAQRTANSSTGRVWLVKNPSRLHPYSGLSCSGAATTLIRSVVRVHQGLLLPKFS